jgi:hypothetical protein
MKHKQIVRATRPKAAFLADVACLPGFARPGNSPAPLKSKE